MTKPLKKSIGNLIVTMKLYTSCGGTLNVAVRKSIVTIASTHGKIQKRPGPFAPPKTKKKTMKFK